MSERSSVQIMISVWKALYLREATFRLFGSRGAWAWLMIEPMIHFAFMIFLFTVIRQRSVSGMDVALWLVIGLTGFFLFRRTAAQAGGALDSNRSLFTYRQVLPFDTIVVRAFLEATIMLATFALIMFGMALYGYDVSAYRGFQVMIAYGGLWFLGLGLGMLIAVLNEIANEARTILNIMMMPLYIASGVIFPLHRVPPQYLDYVLLNPIVHGLEIARAGFGEFYVPINGANLAYLYEFGLVMFAFSLLLYRRLSDVIMAK